ncbi:MAG TPA: hypothetical protein VLK27_05320 [Chthoniobacterales bacterium]|nr:hypothetical protein [Chthoniobacterales bacterium]
MSPQARRERAYHRYVEKQMKQRKREMARAQKEANRQLKRKLKNLQPSDPQLTTSLEDVSPTSYSEPSEPAAPPTSQADTVVPPVTVSASDAIATQDPQQPTRP